MTPTKPSSIRDLVQLDRYPINEPCSSAYKAAVEGARQQLHDTGCALNKDFVQPDALIKIGREIWDRKHTTHFSAQRMNPYFHTTVNPEYGPNHPVNTFIERSSGFIPGDSWDSGCDTDRLFRSSEVARFLADCLEVPTLHCYADPLAGLTANILDPGQQFTWHFDTNDFAVTVLVEEANEGGLFEYVPAIRSAEDEGFGAITEVLADGRDGVISLDLRPGDLQIFRGRHSLHRVTRVAPDSAPRHAVIFAYTEQPNVIGRLERTRQLFGRVLPAHEEAEVARVRGDTLLD